MFREYRPPKELRALFIVHYAPLLLIIMIGPFTGIFGVWELPINKILTGFQSYNSIHNPTNGCIYFYNTLHTNNSGLFVYSTITNQVE